MLVWYNLFFSFLKMGFEKVALKKKKKKLYFEKVQFDNALPKNIVCLADVAIGHILLNLIGDPCHAFGHTALILRYQRNGIILCISIN